MLEQCLDSKKSLFKHWSAEKSEQCLNSCAANQCLNSDFFTVKTEIGLLLAFVVEYRWCWRWYNQCICRVVWFCLLGFRWENIISGFIPRGKLGRQGASSVFPMHHIYKFKRDIKCARASINSILADRTIPSALYLAWLVHLWWSWLASKYYTRFGKMQFLTITP